MHHITSNIEPRPKPHTLQRSCLTHQPRVCWNVPQLQCTVRAGAPRAPRGTPHPLIPTAPRMSAQLHHCKLQRLPRSPSPTPPVYEHVCACVDPEHATSVWSTRPNTYTCVHLSTGLQAPAPVTSAGSHFTKSWGLEHATARYNRRP